MSETPPAPRPGRGIHRFASLLAVGVLGLIAAGGLVKSLEAGLSVPDWPLSYGMLNPPRWWEIQTVRAEHGHRLYAGLVALATVVLAVSMARRESRRWVRRLAWLAVAAVLAQALLGGLTVLLFLPPQISVTHAALAQLFLCLVSTLALVTSSWWHRAETWAPRPALRPTARLATAASGLIFVQILLGALVRHTGAGLAIPDFPLVFGGLVPAEWTGPVALHYAHRAGALAVLAVVAWLTARVWRAGGSAGLPRAATAVMSALVAVQIALGGAIVLTGRAVAPNTLHVPTGAALLATSVVAALSSWRLAGAALRRERVEGRGTALREVA